MHIQIDDGSDKRTWFRPKRTVASKFHDSAELLDRRFDQLGMLCFEWDTPQEFAAKLTGHRI